MPSMSPLGGSEFMMSLVVASAVCPCAMGKGVVGLPPLELAWGSFTTSNWSWGCLVCSGRLVPGGPVVVWTGNGLCSDVGGRDGAVGSLLWT